MSPCPHISSLARHGSRGAAALAIFVGILVLVGWSFDIARLKSVAPGFVTMKPNTALGLMIAGGSLWIHTAPGHRAGRWGPRAARMGAAVVVLIGALTLSEIIAVWDLGIDQLLFQDDAFAVRTTTPGRMAPPTAVVFVLLGASLLLLGSPGAALATQCLALTAALITGIVLLGYLFGESSLYAIGQHNAMSPHVVVSFMALSVGILCAQPDRGWMVNITSGTAGGQTARRLLVPCILVPVLLNRLVNAGERRGYFDLALGSVFSVLSTIIVLSALILWHAIHLRAKEEEHARMAEALLQTERDARAKAEWIDRMKDEFLATLSHELRTPLTSVLGWTSILQKKKDADSVRMGLAVIERNARAQERLIADLLDMNRVVSGKLWLDIQSVALPSIVEVAMDTVRVAAEAKAIELSRRFDLPPGECVVLGDPHRLQQILWNLLSNAVKFTPKGGKVEVTLREVNASLEVRVADTGQGITRAFLPHAFERFRQADASKTRRHGGLGLGLAIAKDLVELHGGTIRAESEGEGKGATFIVRLPALAAHQEPDSAGGRDAPLPSGNLPVPHLSR